MQAIHLIQHMIYSIIVKLRGLLRKVNKNGRNFKGQPCHFHSCCLDVFLCCWHSAQKNVCQKKLFYKCISHIQGLPLLCIILFTYELRSSSIPLSIDGSYTTPFLNSIVNSRFFCVYCSGSRAQFRTMLSCSSHITVLSYKTSWWHGFSQGQTLLSISVYQIHLALIMAQCWWTTIHVQDKALVHNCITVCASIRKMDIVRLLGSHFTDNGK